MKINTRQAADRLGIRSLSTVAGLVKKKLLTDISGKNGRHEYLFDNREVAELAKTYRSRSVSARNGQASESSQANGFGQRLARIEQKLDQSIRLYS